MATLKWLVFALIIGALLPAGRDFLNEMLGELAGTKATPRGDDKAKTSPRRAELDKNMELLRGHPR